ncbi:endonuclease/exonuclease/phosphatase family protein [Humibacter sp. RRB41]|uniref:endonuclease/exonuclease/phosphatase family protein n=1 Tax=Humibacter sp. RRB41 TaxID=2919946 RepID=UPI001FAA260B|nr:endonuclease/exonuclease/phosphatase family protein [Humibacter sp. RRB41]
MRILSYNLRKNRATGELLDLAASSNADVMCLQEADTTVLPAEVGTLKLADSTKRNRLGLAVYFREDRFHLRETDTYELKKSLHDRVLAPAHERLVGTLLEDVDTGNEIVVASFHAAPLTALNSLRRTQIHAAHAELLRLGHGAPTLMIGDYNYPFFTQSLGEKVKASGYDMSLSDRKTYTRYKFFKGHFDFVTSAGLDVRTVETLPRGDSDHMPIVVAAEYSAESAQ